MPPTAKNNTNHHQTGTTETSLVPYNGTNRSGITETSLVPYNGRPTERVEAIMRKFVSTNSELRYTSENVIFMMWLFDEDPEMHLYDWALESLYSANEKDVESFGNQGQRKHLRQACKDLLSKINKVDKNCPIILTSITFNLFSHYMTTRKNKKGNLLSKSGYGGLRSALSYLFKVSGCEIPKSFSDDLSQFIRGIKREIAEEKTQNGESMEEGKKPMTFDTYKLMCRLLFESDAPEAPFAHLFLVLEWNLMARSDNCTKLHLAHIEWRQDCLVFFFSKTKGDQTGEKSEEPWHVYSNPGSPHLCPVLTLL